MALRRALAVGLSLLGLISAATATAQDEAAADRGERHRPPSDPGRPSGPMNPPGVITPLTGSAITPLSPDYLGDPPDPTANGFQNPPGFLPRGNPPRPPGQGRPDRPSIPVILPPASTGRQGLPPQTWNLLTPRQQDMHRQAQTAAMSSPLGEGFVWDDNGRHGDVRVVGDRLYNNRPCRDYLHVVLIDGQRVDGATTICR